MRRSVFVGVAALGLVLGCNKGADKPADKAGDKPAAPPAAKPGEKPEAKPVTKGPEATPPAGEKTPPPTGEKKDLGKDELAELQKDTASWGTLLPSPDEVLQAIDAVATDMGKKPDWAAYVKTPGALKADAPREVVALAAGARVTDFFLLIHAKNNKDAKPITEQLIACAEKLGVGDAVRERAKGLVSALDAGKWEQVRLEMDGIYAAIRTQLVDGLADAETALLVGVGAWAESIYVASAYLKGNYSDKTSELLRQWGVARYFAERLKKLPGKMGQSQAVLDIAKEMDALKGLMKVPQDKGVPAEDVQKIQDSAGRIKALL